MKMFNLFTGAAAITLMTACSANVSAPPNPFEGLEGAFKSWPAYSEQTLSGKIFGKDWQAVTAIARKINDKEVGLEFYPEVKAKACTTQVMSSRPYATVVIPANYTVTEYIADMKIPGTTNPIVFSELSANAKNLIAEKTKVRVNSISAGGLSVSVYATGVDSDGISSEINGKIDVVDCAKAVDFSVWDELAGWYTLSTFVGNAVTARTSIIEYSTSKFYDRGSQRYLKTLIFPLYYSVGQNSDASYGFGPMEGLGLTTVTSQNGIKTYKYSYSGPITYKGMDITMTLDLSVTVSARNYDVAYSLEIPGQVAKTVNTYTIVK